MKEYFKIQILVQELMADEFQTIFRIDGVINNKHKILKTLEHKKNLIGSFIKSDLLEENEGNY